MFANVQLNTTTPGKSPDLIATAQVYAGDYLFFHGEFKKLGDANLGWSIKLGETGWVCDASNYFGVGKFVSLQCQNTNCNWNIVLQNNRVIGVALIATTTITANTVLSAPNPFETAAFCSCHNNATCQLLLPPASDEPSDKSFQQWLCTATATPLQTAFATVKNISTEQHQQVLDKLYDLNW